MVRVALVLSAVVFAEEAYEKEWADFQAAQGPRNSKIPDAFISNVEEVKRHNVKDSTFKLSYTGPFADKSSFELAQVLGFRTTGVAVSLPRLGSHVHSGGPALDSLDWTTRGAVTQIKDQAHCGSCWAFSSTGAVEGQWQLATDKLVALSEQQLVDCNKKGNFGCNGGLMDNAFNFYTNYAIASEASYPYLGKSGTCTGDYETVIPNGGVIGYKDVGADESLLLDAVTSVGPISVAIEADQSAFHLYDSGIITSGCGTQLDHGVLLVGFGEENGLAYWKIKNSWGSSWGDSGYVRIQRGVNMCGIKGQGGDHGPSYPLVNGAAPPTPPTPAPPPPPPPSPPVPGTCCWGDVRYPLNCTIVANCHHDDYCDKSQQNCQQYCQGIWCPFNSSSII